PERIGRLPDSAGMPNEIVVHRSHRLNYDQMYRLAGARLVEIGVPYETERWELERAITERTAAIAYVDSRNVGPGALPFATVVEIARARGVPTIVDAASTVPPLSHLHCWSGWGADLVIFSGGKGIRGPQDSGLLAGRANLIAAARANGSPNSGIGRGMKVSKEAMAGLWKALDLFQLADHAADFAAHLAQADVLCDALGSRPDLWTAIEGDWADRPAPVVRVFPQRDAWSPEAVRRDLMRPAPGTPAIHVDVQRGGLQISTHCLLPGQELVIARRLGEILGPGQ
ncbi:MAG: aminotransferase class V-fold PLP-dependent enzyme, partial [Thermomicrobiales bacterium]